MNKVIKALAGGLAGACAVTLVHETVRRFTPNAPRMDILGMRSIAKLMREADEQPPSDRDELHTWALVGDVLSNSLYYSLAGTGKDAWWKGSVLGAAAGAGAVFLPGPLGLGEEPSNKTTETQAMAVAYYLLGGLVAAAVGYALGDEE
ncbi:hypothetical protein CLV24_12840 [Pontibacter ummariensis]|uniref:Uncharacterized protein n=1 Tax=Pontibacter ummariensis TaxID=1610492 RepID=A0A239KAF1_9BACT|nr:hypothetical protein [Pontibacter ummariensis]PRY06058.1 hypothetical protein CLV24_12840 [Pontibacter ummariensis]SNT14672.1 hypothetical protein SAMN06296052_12740 [Pontibacter ummariensis]